MLSESQATNRRGSAGLDPTRSNGAIGAIGVIALLGSGASPKSALSWKRQAIPTSISSITLSRKVQTAFFFPRIVLSSTVLHIHEIHEMSLSHDRINAVYSRMFLKRNALSEQNKKNPDQSQRPCKQTSHCWNSMPRQNVLPPLDFCWRSRHRLRLHLLVGMSSPEHIAIHRTSQSHQTKSSNIKNATSKAIQKRKSEKFQALQTFQNSTGSSEETATVARLEMVARCGKM